MIQYILKNYVTCLESFTYTYSHPRYRLWLSSLQLVIQVHGSYFSLPRKLPDKLQQLSLWRAILMEIRKMEVVKTA